MPLGQEIFPHAILGTRVRGWSAHLWVNEGPVYCNRLQSEVWLRGISVESGDRNQGAAAGGGVNILNIKT